MVGHDDLDLHLGKEIDHVLRAAVEFGVTLLPAEALDLGGREARDAYLGQRLLHLIQLEGLDDRFDLLHVSPRLVECGILLDATPR